MIEDTDASRGDAAAPQGETEQRWVAFGPEGAVGSIHRTEGGFLVRMRDGGESTFPSLEIAKSALHANLAPGSDWPDYREH